MGLAQWSFLAGLLLITMVLIGTLLKQLPLSSAMIYLGTGYLLGPGGLALIAPDPLQHAGAFMLASEVAVLIALFSVGLKMGITPFDGRWRLPLRLATVSMAATVGLISFIGMAGLGLSLGAAVLLGGILAPTDPVLASGVQLDGRIDPDQVRFSLAGEGGLNDGTAFPFVMLGLGLLGLHDLGRGGSLWWGLDLLWATLAGLAIGAALGALIGWLVVRLRTRHASAVGLHEFLCLGLMAMSYGAAQACLASGFLAVFAAGVALQRVKEQPMNKGVAQPASAAPAAPTHETSSNMSREVLDFNEQLEKVAELAIVLLVGAMLPFTHPSLWAFPVALWWFIPLLFLIVRPLAVWLGAVGEQQVPGQRRVISWFGIRGIGSVFYLMFAIRQGVDVALAQTLISFTLITVAVSIVVHGLTAKPIMKNRRRVGASARSP